MERMEALKGRAAENGIAIEEISAATLRRIEPNVAGLGAILVPATGIVDYRQICEALAERLRDAGVVVVASAGNDGVDTSVTPVYPGSHLIENVVAVGSSSRSDIVPLSSNYGVGTVDLVAHRSSRTRSSGH